MGKLIRLRNYATVVPNNTQCLSACALAWLGGTERYMGSTARIGFHAAYLRTTGQETGAGNALLGAYLSQIGLSEAAIFYIAQAPPTSMTLLTIADAKRFGIDVSVLDLSKNPNREQASPPTSRNSVAQLNDWTRQFIFTLYHKMSATNDIALAAMIVDAFVRWVEKT